MDLIYVKKLDRKFLEHPNIKNVSNYILECIQDAKSKKKHLDESLNKNARTF